MQTPHPTAKFRLFTQLSLDPWFYLGLAVSLVACVWPLWASALLPFMDLPQHLAVVRILHSYADASFGVAHYHAVDFSGTQYLSYYLLTDWLTYLMPLEVANRVVLSLYAIGVPLAMVAYLRAHGRDQAIALLAAPLVYNTFLFMGFANYVTAIPLLIWGLAVLQRLLDDFSRARLVLLTAVSLLLFYSHAQTFVLYGLLAGISCLFGSRGWHPRHWWRAAAHIAPALLLMAIWASKSLLLASAQDWKSGHGGRNVADAHVNFEPILERFATLPAQFLDAYRDDADEIVLCVWLAIAALALVSARGLPLRDAQRDNAGVVNGTELPRFWLRRRLPEILFAVSAAVYVLSPISYKWIWPISHRLVPVVALLGLGAIGYRRLPWRPLVLIVPATLLMLYASQMHVRKAREFTAEAGPIRQVVAQAERGKRLMALIFNSGSTVVNQAPYIHFGQYYVIDRGGMASFSFANFPQSPVVYPTEGGPPTLPARFEWTPERFSWAEYGNWYDYFLLRDENGRNVFGADRDQVELVARQGVWSLYKKRAVKLP